MTTRLADVRPRARGEISKILCNAVDGRLLADFGRLVTRRMGWKKTNDILSHISYLSQECPSVLAREMISKICEYDPSRQKSQAELEEVIEILRGEIPSNFDDAEEWLKIQLQK